MTAPGCTPGCLCACQQISCGCHLVVDRPKRPAAPQGLRKLCNLCEQPARYIKVTSPAGQLVEVMLCGWCDVVRAA